eukprot:scaffold7380_cov115-Isochrysis_galbana.AAC.4
MGWGEGVKGKLATGGGRAANGRPRLPPTCRVAGASLSCLNDEAVRERREHDHTACQEQGHSHQRDAAGNTGAERPSGQANHRLGSSAAAPLRHSIAACHPGNGTGAASRSTSPDASRRAGRSRSRGIAQLRIRPFALPVRYTAVTARAGAPTKLKAAQPAVRTMHRYGGVVWSFIRVVVTDAERPVPAGQPLCAGAAHSAQRQHVLQQLPTLATLAATRARAQEGTRARPAGCATAHAAARTGACTGSKTACGRAAGCGAAGAGCCCLAHLGLEIDQHLDELVAVGVQIGLQQRQQGQAVLLLVDLAESCC